MPCAGKSPLWQPDVVQRSVKIGCTWFAKLTVPIAQPPGTHASHALVNVLAHAEPPAGGLQCPGSLAIALLVTPFEFVLHQTTAPGFPHVDFAAQRCTVPLQAGLSWSATMRPRMTPDAHLTYVPCVGDPVQSHVASIAARASAIGVASAPAGSHLA